MIDIFSTGKSWYDEKRKQLDKSIEIEGLDGWTRFVPTFRGFNGELPKLPKYKRDGKMVLIQMSL